MFGRIRNLLRTTPSDPAISRFASEALRLLEDVRRSRDDWHLQVDLTSDYHALANLAAVRRWQLARLAGRLSAMEPAPALRHQAAEGIRAMLLVADGFQRLAHGYRFSKFERVCDGHALLEDGWARCERVTAELQTRRAHVERQTKGN